MNPYDKARELAQALKNSEEFVEYKKLKDKVMANESYKERIEDFRDKVLQHQVKEMEGKASEEDKEKLVALSQALTINPEIAEFMMAEAKFFVIYEDIIKIIGEAVE